MVRGTKAFGAGKGSRSPVETVDDAATYYITDCLWMYLARKFCKRNGGIGMLETLHGYTTRKRL